MHPGKYLLPLLLAVLTVLCRACGPQPEGLSDAEEPILARIRAVRNLRAQTDWPDFAAAGSDAPLLYLTDSVCYAVDPEDRFRERFRARLCRRGDGIALYKALLPDAQEFHMETQLDFGDTTAYNARVPYLFCSSPETAARFIPDIRSDSDWLPMVLHEYAHGYQFRQPGFAAAFARTVCDLPEEELGRLHTRSEWFGKAVEAENDALLAAIAARGEGRDSCIARFRTLRRARKERMAVERGDSAVRMEELYELMEGMARCVEAGAGFRSGCYSEDDTWLWDTRSSAYFFATGYNIMRLLDSCGADRTHLFTDRIRPLEDFLPFKTIE